MARRVFCVIFVLLYEVDPIFALNQQPPGLSVDTLQAQYGLIEYAGLVSNL